MSPSIRFFFRRSRARSSLASYDRNPNWMLQKKKASKTAFELARLAIEADERRNYDKAVEYYSLAIEKLLKQSKGRSFFMLSLNGALFIP